MKLTLKNIGKIREASVELNGITVIAGENNTGKSNVNIIWQSWKMSRPILQMSRRI